MKQLMVFLAIGALFTTAASAQYKQEEDVKHPLQKIFPEAPFDSVAAKNGLGEGTVTLQGIAFTRAPEFAGFQAADGGSDLRQPHYGRAVSVHALLRGMARTEEDRGKSEKKPGRR